MKVLSSLLALLAVLPSIADGHTQLAGNDQGHGVLITPIQNQTGRPLYASIRGPSGAFGSLRPISPAYPFEYEQVAVDDSGAAVAVWSRFHFGGFPSAQVFAAVRPQGERFGSPRLLGRGADYLLLAVNGRGDSIVVWPRDTRPTQYSFRPAGGSFSPPIAIQGADAANAIALDDDGGAFLVWSRTSGNMASYRPPGGSFGPPQPVTGLPLGQALSATAIATDRDGDMLVVWREGDALMGMERPARAASFGAPFTVATGLRKKDSILALTVAPSGRAAVAYGAPPVEVALREAGVWTAPQEIPVGARTFDYTLDMNRRGDAALAWTGLDRALHAVYRPATGTFGLRRRLAQPRPFAPGEYARPGLAIDGQGRATATWEESDGEHVSMYARDFNTGSTGKRMRIGRLRSFRREGPASNCRPSGARVIKSTRQATVFVATRGEDAGYHYACLRARGAPISLDDVEVKLFPPIALAGPLVGYAWDSCDPDRCETSVSVTDLRDEGNGVTRGAIAGPGGTSEVPALVMKPNGALAWVSCSAYNPEYGRVHACNRGRGKRKRVFALDRRRSRPRLLQVSRRIVPGSLRLHGSRLSWLDGRKRHTARLH